MNRLLALFFLGALISTGAADGKDFVFAGYNVENYAPVAIPGETKTGKDGPGRKRRGPGNQRDLAGYSRRL